MTDREILKEARDLIVMCSLIDKSGKCEDMADKIDKQLSIPIVSESIFDKAVKQVQETYCDAHLSTPYMLLGDVAELIKITTGKEVDWNVLVKYSR